MTNEAQIIETRKVIASEIRKDAEEVRKMIAEWTVKN